MIPLNEWFCLCYGKNLLERACNMACLFVERLTVIDFSYLDPQRGLVGESWIMDVELIGKLDEQGMVFDFSKVKKTIKKWVDNQLDHKLLVATASGHYQPTGKDLASLRFQLETGEHILHRGSADSVAILESLSTITSDAVARFIENELKLILPDNIDRVAVRLYAESITGNFYHYSHGLQQHQGNCQRIAHGHRSAIHVEVNGERSEYWESFWGKRFKDIYIGTREHLVKASTAGYSAFEYVSQQGLFKLELPTSSCYLMDTETTVEQIATQIATEMTALVDGEIKVKAFEGVGKGAIASAVGHKTRLNK